MKEKVQKKLLKVINQHQSYAPFGSVQSKNKKKKKNQPMQQLGPGAYDISLPIIKPIVQTITKKNNNIIVKLSHIGTSSFQGQHSRFQQKIKQNQSKVGPGKYSPQKAYQYIENHIKSNKTQIQRKYAGIQLMKFIKNRQRKAATFSEVKKIQIDQYVQMPMVQKKQNNNNDKNYMNKIKGPAWSKMKEERVLYAKKSKNDNKIGPGYYNYNIEERSRKYRSKSQNHASSAFKSQSIRSFFDQIYYQTNQQKKAQLRDAQNYKSDSIGPGAYDTKDLLQKKQNKFQFFGSMEERILM